MTTVGKLVAASLVWTLSFGLGGCAATKSPDLVPIESVEALGPGMLAVDVENVRGAVEVRSQPGLKSPIVEALRLDGSTGEAPRSFVASQLVTSQNGAVLRVVSADKAEAQAPSMLLRVHVPACDGLRVRTSGGDVLADGVGGAITIDTTGKVATSGGVRLIADRPIIQPMAITCESGDIYVSIPVHSDVTMTLDGSNGSKLMTNSARVVVKKVTVKHIEATVGEGLAPMQVRTEGGSVRVHVQD